MPRVQGSAGRKSGWMEITTAAEPKSGEREWSKFDEVLAQMDEGAILELREAAGLARHEENFETTRVSGKFVAAQGARQIGVGLETSGEDHGVFDGEAGALAEIGADGMSGVAENGDSSHNPGKRGEAVLNVRLNDVFGVFDEIWNRSVPAGEECLEGDALGENVRGQGVIGCGVPVDATGAEAENAEAPATAVGFGKVAVVLEAKVGNVAFGINVGDPAPDAVVAIAEFGFEAEGFADGGMNAIASDDEICFGGGAIFKMKKDGVWALLQARESMAQVDGTDRHGLREGGLQFGAVNGDAGAIVGGKRKSFDGFAAGIFHQHAAEKAAASCDAGEYVPVNLIEGPDGVGPEAHAGADFSYFSGSFVDVHFETDFAERNGGGESADAAANNGRTFHDCPQGQE
jgi:hypothetical protein